MSEECCEQKERQVEPRPEMGPKYIAWNQLKKQRDYNRRVAADSDLIMQAIEAAPELDEAMCISMGIKAQVPPGMQK